MDQYGLRRACQWAGNSPATAMKNYALVRRTDFIDAGNLSDQDEIRRIKSDARTESNTKSDAEPDSTEKQKRRETKEKAALARTVKSCQYGLMSAEGLEPPTLSV